MYAIKQLPVDTYGENTVIGFCVQATEYYRYIFYWLVEPFKERKLAYLLVSTLGSTLQRFKSCSCWQAEAYGQADVAALHYTMSKLVKVAQFSVSAMSVPNISM